MPVLTGRKVSLSVDTIQVSADLRVKAQGVKTYKPEPNTCEVTIWGLSPEHRQQLTKVKTPIVKLAAGYGKDLTQLFYGQALHVTHEIDGPEILTTVTTSDSGSANRHARINTAFGPGTRAGTMLKAIVQALGVKPGNLATVAAELDRTLATALADTGLVVSGPAATELSAICRSAGYDWSVQDGALQLRKFGKEADGFAVTISPDTGLIGSPAISNKGVCTGTCLVFRAGQGLDMVPGRLIRVDSRFVKGQFILAKVDFDIDTYAEPWFYKFEAVARKGDFKLVS